MSEVNKYALAIFSFVYCGGVLGSEAPTSLARANFDLQALKENNLNPALADYYAFASRFTPGEHVVSLSINGQKVGLVTVQFDNHGQLCADDAFLAQARIKKEKNSTPEQCRDLTTMWSNGIVDLDPNMGEVTLTLPVNAIDNTITTATSNYNGGVAGLLNYNGYVMHNDYQDDSSDRYQGNFQLGFNAGDWIFRSTQLVSNDSDSSFQHDSLFTYAQRTFTDYEKLLQLGEFSVTNTQFGLPTIRGLQWIPDTSLAPGKGSGIDVTGIAHTNRAQVEVRQSGTLIYSTLVPAGPFTLPDIPVISGNTDLEVMVKENDGSQHQTTVSASTFRGNQLNRVNGFSLTAGQVEDLNSRYPDPWVLTMSQGWFLSRRLNASAGMLMADNHYYGFSGRLDAIPFQSVFTSLGYLDSIDNQSQTDGQKFTFDASYVLPYNVGISVGSSYSTHDYRELTDMYSDYDDLSLMKYESNVSLSWGHDVLGGFSLNYYRGQAWNSEGDSRTFSTSWYKTFDRVTVNVNWQTDVGHSDNNDRMLYVSLSVPLGNVSTTHWVRNRKKDTTWGSGISGSLSANNQYSLGVEKRYSDDDAASLSGSLSSNLHYTSLSLTADADDRSNRTYSATVQGGVVVHPHGVTFSPYSIEDTFGLVTLDKPVAGVEIETSRGAVWTDKWGQAVVPSLSPNRDSWLDLNTQTLPQNIDVNNGKAILNVSRGSVANWQFSTLSQRRVMIDVKQANGEKLPAGTAIVDQSGQYITTAPDSGIVFLNDTHPGHQLFALTESKRCALHFSLPQKVSEAFFEEVKGTCE
ncbi:fimbrial biogenesis outer membrane usher protein [Salmonella enterica subsp. salamae]|nr:fimbria/pilus outer membrane usher protein [Salmonella enterica subsp. salamae]ECI4076429.1 fimbrial biogenesis outer membrane usher protein [Salmonella enterica subsp. salamae]EEO2380528.1 fimbrial biogenesis usher protein [Salmonella enterica]